MSEDRPAVALGVCGGIAAYKSCDLVRRLRETGYDVHVVMTHAAAEFVTPLTFQTLSGNPVITDQFQQPEEYGVNHIGLARRARVLVVAPATANVIGKMAHGVADDFLTTMITATYSPVLLAPSMNTGMWRSDVVQENLRTLLRRGVEVVPPGEGSLACDEVGVGRMAEVGAIVDAVRRRDRRTASLEGCRVVVNAGPTREALDSVRYLSNRSTGRMGILLAATARDRGADVTLVLGPTELDPPDRVRLVPVVSADEMLNATLAAVEGSDVAVLSAAVSDFAPVEAASGKVKKEGASLTLELRRTSDVLKSVSQRCRPPVLVGFAAEHGDPEAESLRKCRDKGCDFVVGNDISAAGAGFGAEALEALVAFEDGRVERSGRMGKRELAELVWDRAAAILKARKAPSQPRSETGDTA